MSDRGIQCTIAFEPRTIPPEAWNIRRDTWGLFTGIRIEVRLPRHKPEKMKVAEFRIRYGHDTVAMRRLNRLLARGPVGDET